MGSRRGKWILGFCVAAVLLAVTSPWLISGCWRVRSSNPVRRGVALAGELGCFSCHGEQGAGGIPEPAVDGQTVPGWSGGVWMMYVESDDEIREFILDGETRRQDDPHQDHVDHKHDEAGISMPAYRAVLDDVELEDLVATFKVLSGMTRPEAGTAERRGYELARSKRCFSCHGPAGSGGYPNPGSFAGFIPGWYGPDFRELVRSREEFDAWIRNGEIPRLTESRVASFFIRRQRVPMPAYQDLTQGELDDLWAYVGWLGETGGGHRAPVGAW